MGPFIRIALRYGVGGLVGFEGYQCSINVLAFKRSQMNSEGASVF